MADPTPSGPGKFDILIRQGTTFSLSCIWRYPRDVHTNAPGPPVDVTGHTAVVKVGELAPVSVTVGDEDGSFMVEIPSGTTQSMDFESVPWCLRVTKPDGDIFDLLAGSAMLERVS